MSRRYKNQNGSMVAILLVLIAVVALLSVLVTKLPDLFDDANDTQQNNSQQTDPSACKHTERTVSYTLKGAEGHQEVMTCSNCEKVISDKVEPHDFDKDGKCEAPGCGYICSHGAPLMISYSYSAMNQHSKNSCCSACGAVLASVVEKHDFKNGICQAYGCAYECVHSGEGVFYVNVDENDAQHIQKGNCTNCGEIFNEELVAHTYLNGSCTKCRHKCAHTGSEVRYEFVDLLSHNQVEYCLHCDYSGMVRYSHQYEDGVCLDCAYKCVHTPSSTETLEFVDELRTNKIHVRKTLCTGCGMVMTVEEAHTFVDGANYCAKGCGFYCEHTEVMSYSPISLSWNMEHEVIVSCSECFCELSRTREACCSWVTDVVHDVAENGHSVSRHCGLCGNQELFSFGEHQFDVCGCCAVCHGYLADSYHDKLERNSGSCNACNRDPDKTTLIE